MTDDESFDRWQVYMSRIVETAKGLCLHYSEDVTDTEGRHLCPCFQCTRMVRHVLEVWMEYFKKDAVAAAEKALESNQLPIVQLHHAYELGMAVLWPEVGKATDSWGPL